MRRRDLLAIAATQQVREMQEGARFANAHFSALRTNFSHSRSVEWYGYLNSSEPFEYVYAENDVANRNKNIAINTEKSILRVIYNGQAPIAKSITSGYYHIVAVLNGEQLATYLNGVAVATIIVAPPTIAPTRVLVGAFNTSMLYPFKGIAGHIREFNYALLPQQIAALYNNGKSEEYLLPTADKVGCIAEYLPQNLITAHDGDMSDKTPIAWLDSAKQLPLNDEYLPPLLQGVGGYDLTALGTPEIVEKARVIQRQEITDFKVEGSISMGGGNSGQAVATLTKTADGSVLHCFGDFCWDDGVVNDQYPRLVCTAKQRAGSGTVRMTLEYEITMGDTQVVHLETYGWSLIKWTNLGVKLAGKFTCQFTSIGLPTLSYSTPRLDFGGITLSGGEYKILVKKLIIEEYDKIIN